MGALPTSSALSPLPLSLFESATCQSPLAWSTEPVTTTNTEVFRSFDSPDDAARSGLSRPENGGFVCEASNSRKPAANRAWGEVTRFQVDSVAGDNGPI
jgi:hypothetical protein